MSDPAATAVAIVANILELNTQALAILAQLTAAKNSLIALGTGKYQDERGRELTVVGPSGGTPAMVVISFSLDATDVDAARKLTGDKFRQVFDRAEVFSPCHGFEHVVPKLLTQGKAAALLDLCKRESRSGGSSPRAGYILGVPKEIPKV